MSAERAETARIANDLAQTIAQLSAKMEVSFDQVREIYSGEVNRLAAEARIQQFVGILAMRRTRNILRENRTRSVQS